jgi:hypothetical protein
MKRFLLVAWIWALQGIGCGPVQPPPEPLDLEQGKKLSDTVALDYFDDNSADLFQRLDAAFLTQVKGPDDLKKVLRHIRFLYGDPVAYDYQAATSGNRQEGYAEKPYLDFWYRLRTTRYPKGNYFLKIEVVRAQGASFQDVGGFGVLTFDQDLPAYLQPVTVTAPPQN